MCLLMYFISDNMTFRILSLITITFQKKTEWYNNWHCNRVCLHDVHHRTKNGPELYGVIWQLLFFTF